MTPGKFLRLIWPDTGFYCIAHPFKLPTGGTTYFHRIFPTISEAVTHVHEQANQRDVFFAVLSLTQDKVWDPDKVDHKTGTKGAYATRVQENMHASKCVFFDLDVGSEPSKYDTQKEALEGLTAFLATTKMPMPSMLSSGGGVHVYWHFDRSVPAEAWREIAWHMRQLAEHLGFKVDPMRTTDITSVLRVPDTFNWKDPANPRPVKVLQEGAISTVEAFEQLLSDAMIRAGVTPTAAPAPGKRAAAAAGPDHGLGQQGFNDFGPALTLGEVASACAQLQEILRSQGDKSHPHYGPLDNPAWYRGMLGVVKHVEDGDNWCRKLTALHPRDVADIDAKLLQLERFPPAKCETLQQYMPWKDSPCQTCRFRNDPSVPNPIAAARKNTPAPAPVLTPSQDSETPPSPSDAAGSPHVTQLVAPSPTLMAAMLPNPPKPYERLKTGEVAVTRKDKDGNESTSIILRHDLYPLKRLVNAAMSNEQQVWRVTLPRSGSRDFTIDADTLYDGRKFTTAMANNGIYPNKADIPALQDYMVAYISQLQKEIDADEQATHLGWADDFRKFILPSKTLLADGTVRASSLSLAAERAAQSIKKKGDLNEQVRLMGWFNHDAYLPNQTVILDALASIIFHLTGHHGIVVNCSGDAGASKSTTLYTSASVWGDPVLWPINGTQRGATANARMQRVATNANLPTFVDEITHMPPREAMDMVMSITQPGHRLRLTTEGVERKVSDDYKSAIMVATANSSLHSLLSTDNAAGTAGSMRVFEMKFAIQNVHTKGEADEFLRQIKMHYGHIGEVFTHFVIRNMVAIGHRMAQVMAQVDAAAKIASSERFWSARIAADHVAAEIAQALHLLPYDPARILAWQIEHQVPFMRGVVKEEYRDPLAVMTDYIAEKHGNIVVIDRTASVGSNTAGQHVVGDTAYAKFTPHGQLLGHFDLRAGVLYLLKQGFKEHCSRIGSSSTRIIEELNAPRSLDSSAPRRIVTERSIRRTLGAGTELAKGQAWCFAIDMTHPEIAGVVPTLAAQGGNPSTPAAGNLQVVK